MFLIREVCNQEESASMKNSAHRNKPTQLEFSSTPPHFYSLVHNQRTFPPCPCCVSRHSLTLFNACPLSFRLPVLGLLLGGLFLLAAPPAAAHELSPASAERAGGCKPTAVMLTWQAPSSWGSFPAAGYEIDWAEGASPPAHSSSDWNTRVIIGYRRPSSSLATAPTGPRITCGSYKESRDPADTLPSSGSRSHTRPIPTGHHPASRR